MKWFVALVLMFAMVSGFAQGGKQLSPTEEKANIAKLLKRNAAAKASYVKKPKDAALKKAYVDSNVALGLQYTYATTVDRKEKYKIALKYFRTALKLDPKNKDARKTHDQIVNIYKSMGRPVPGEDGGAR